MGAARARRRTAGAVAVVLSVLVGPLPLVPVRVLMPPSAGALTCGTRVEAAVAAPDAATGTAALRAAVAGAATADPACAAWTVELVGAFTLDGDLVHAAELPLVLRGAGEGRAELRGTGVARLVTLLRPATDLTVEGLVLRGGDATGTDLDGVGGAIGAEVASIADPTPSRVAARDAVLVGNRAEAGGAIAADEVVLTDVDVVANEAPLGGGVDVATLRATRTQFVANLATLAPGQGGAVRASGDVTLETVTLSGNSSRTGGSIWMSGLAAPVLRATASTFADARSDDGGHIAADLSAGGSLRLVLRGTVLAGVAPLTTDGPTPAVCVGASRHAGPAPDVTVAALATDDSCPDAAELAEEPVLTQLPGSVGEVEGRPRLVVPAASGPLVDVADCGTVWPTVDARGVARPQPGAGRCDAGAVEVEVAPPPVVPAPSPSPPEPDPPVDVEVPAVPTEDAARRPAAVRAGDAGPAHERRDRRLSTLLRALRRR